MSTIPRIIDSDSDSDDDVPLSALRANIPVKKAMKIEVKDEVKREVPPLLPNGVGRGKRQEPPGSDSEDDVPISNLAKRKKLKVETKIKLEKVQITTHNSRSTPALHKTKKRVIKIKIRQQECTEELYESLKGQLVQELLCRWWYAMEWPPVKKPVTTLHGVQELDGYPGAFIRVKGDDLGSIIDTRPSVGKPSFLHFFAMPSDELLKLLLQAYDKQMEVLVEHEGPGTSLFKKLQKARALAARINADKADRSVQKGLKKFAELKREIEEVKALALKEAKEGNEDYEGDEGEGDMAED